MFNESTPDHINKVRPEKVDIQRFEILTIRGTTHTTRRQIIEAVLCKSLSQLASARMIPT
jgi:hypothetical protein